MQAPKRPDIIKFGNMNYAPVYGSSHALVVGINSYTRVGPLAFAENDAQAVAAHLISDGDFPRDNVCVLLGPQATKAAVLSKFFALRQATGNDDRVLFFYAGHGHTIRGHRGEVGYLIPHDGDPDDPSTLVRWSELIEGADLIPAKHLFFIMDACYGGIALQRSVSPGSARFLAEMLRRRSRQVLTAGKADEVVSDGNGPRAGHSIFTGHLLDGLSGAASANDKIITATSLMHYVYEKVGTDQHSQQTPHYGHVGGDGDVVLRFPATPPAQSTPTSDVDVLLHYPATSPSAPSPSEPLSEVVKECLSDSRLRIRLHDMLAGETRAFLHETRRELFALGEPRDVEGIRRDFSRRLEQYDRASSRIQVALTHVARWGRVEHVDLIASTLRRITDPIDSESGLLVWLGMRWFPALVVIYSSGIGALAGDNWAAFKSVIDTKVPDPRTGGVRPLLTAVIEGMNQVDRGDGFKMMAGHERHYVPRSEFLFKLLQPRLEDALFLGSDYERLFDTMEVLIALAISDAAREDGKPGWGPPGRFAWKEKRSSGPLTALLKENETLGQNNPILATGLFGGSSQRLQEVGSAYMERMRQWTWH